MNMIERVALAISGSDNPDNILTIHRIRARLAIEAMREPTEEMLDSLNGVDKSSMTIKEWYQILIDAALKED